MGRFINADALVSTGQGLLGNNMFAYCNNGPVVGYDPTGAMACFTFLGDAHIFSDQVFMGGCGGGGWNPGLRQWLDVADKAVDFIANTDEQVVLEAESFAFYKGALVIKCSFLGDSAISFGVILMGDRVTNPELVKHERGHINQLIELGAYDYLSYVAIPSVACYWLTEWDVLPRSLYHSLPWEYKANEYGQATFLYSEWADTVSDLYWFYVKIKSATS